MQKVVGVRALINPSDAVHGSSPGNSFRSVKASEPAWLLGFCLFSIRQEYVRLTDRNTAETPVPSAF
jgi:hypothetical protein